MNHLPMVKLTVREAATLLQIAEGWDGAADISETDVNQLQSLGLVEQRGASIGLTATGRQSVVRLRRV